MNASRGIISSSAEASRLSRPAAGASLPESEVPLSDSPSFCSAAAQIFSQSQRTAPPERRLAEACCRLTNTKIIGIVSSVLLARAVAWASCSQVTTSCTTLSSLTISASTASSKPGAYGGKTLTSSSPSGCLSTTSVDASSADVSSATTDDVGQGTTLMWHASLGARHTAASTSHSSHARPKALWHTSRIKPREGRMCWRRRHCSTACKSGQDKCSHTGEA
mmetsp:Transcript_37669/g.117386  ORF Transcript_37669/g.117386 Transcript_37669/m.117386 type:complete len:221 (+) Transcript_37669:1088-1750(+)